MFYQFLIENYFDTGKKLRFKEFMSYSEFIIIKTKLTKKSY